MAYATVFIEISLVSCSVYKLPMKYIGASTTPIIKYINILLKLVVTNTGSTGKSLNPISIPGIKAKLAASKALLLIGSVKSVETLQFYIKITLSILSVHSSCQTLLLLCSTMTGITNNKAVIIHNVMSSLLSVLDFLIIVMI